MMHDDQMRETAWENIADEVSAFTRRLRQIREHDGLSRNPRYGGWGQPPARMRANLEDLRTEIARWDHATGVL